MPEDCTGHSRYFARKLRRRRVRAVCKIRERERGNFAERERVAVSHCHIALDAVSIDVDGHEVKERSRYESGSRNVKRDVLAVCVTVAKEQLEHGPTDQEWARRRGRDHLVEQREEALETHPFADVARIVTTHIALVFVGRRQIECLASVEPD